MAEQARLQKLLQVIPGGFAVHLDKALEIPETKPAAGTLPQEIAELAGSQLAMGAVRHVGLGPFEPLIQELVEAGMMHR